MHTLNKRWPVTGRKHVLIKKYALNRRVHSLINQTLWLLCTYTCSIGETRRDTMSTGLSCLYQACRQEQMAIPHRTNIYLSRWEIIHRLYVSSLLSFQRQATDALKSDRSQAIHIGPSTFHDLRIVLLLLYFTNQRPPSNSSLPLQAKSEIKASF